MTEPIKMKPVIILPIGKVTRKDIRELRKNNFCVIEAEDPGAVRFLEPPLHGYSANEVAAMKLCRYLLSKNNQYSLDRYAIASKLAFIMTEGTPLAESTSVEKVKAA